MNKTLQDIINEMLSAKESSPELSALTSTSKTSIWRQILEVIAFVIFNFQEAVKLHSKEIDDKIATQKVPRLAWYREIGLAFQYGFELLPESDQFSPTYEENGQQIIATTEKIEQSKIIKYCAVTRSKTSNGRVKISMKIAGQNSDEILEDEKALAFKNYIEEIQAAGDDIVIVNFLPDILKLNFKIAIDPLVLTNTGMSVLTATYPVQETIERFLLNLPFDGELSVQRLREAIKATEGVNDLLEENVQSKWINPVLNGYDYFQPIEISRIPKSGRYKIEDWTGLNYINYQAQP